MRTVRKRAPPASFTQWRTPRMAANRGPGMECTYEELRRDACIVDVEDGLFAEQGGICAYTGLRLGLNRATSTSREPKGVGFHIEHITAQEHCGYGVDADYANMLACWPRPNCGFDPEFGARRKDNWPAPGQAASFVSPLRRDCSTRFTFDHRGKVSCSDEDAAATETIRELGLDHARLVELRRQSVNGALAPGGKPITLREAIKLLARLDNEVQQLDSGASVNLMEFCFVIRPALEREIRKLRGIRESRRQ